MEQLAMSAEMRRTSMSMSMSVCRYDASDTVIDTYFTEPEIVEARLFSDHCMAREHPMSICF